MELFTILLDNLSFLWETGLPFLVALTILVFVHELGHYMVARWCNVRVEVFSVGFGKELIERIEQRTTKMIKLGAIKEVKKFRNLKLSNQSSVNKVIGIKELSKFLEKEIKIEEAKELISIRTRQYAKRQATWARSKMTTWSKIETKNFKFWVKKINL